MTEGVKMEQNRDSVRDKPVQAVAEDYPPRTDAPVSQDRFDHLINALLSPSPREIDEYPPQPRQSYCGYGPYHPEDPSAGDRLRSILGSLADSYTEQDKYTGLPLDFFVTKFRLFSDRCCRYAVPEDVLRRAFPIMLADGPLDFYLHELSTTAMTFDEIVLAIHARFDSRRNRDLHLAIFNELTLRQVMNQCPAGTTRSGAIEILIRQLEAIYYGYHSPSSTDKAQSALLLQLERAMQEFYHYDNDPHPLAQNLLVPEDDTFRRRIADIRNVFRLDRRISVSNTHVQHTYRRNAYRAAPQWRKRSLKPYLGDRECRDGLHHDTGCGN